MTMPYREPSERPSYAEFPPPRQIDLTRAQWKTLTLQRAVIFLAALNALARAGLYLFKGRGTLDLALVLAWLLILAMNVWVHRSTLRAWRAAP